MPFADKFHELTYRGRELRKQVDQAREKANRTKSRNDLKAFEEIQRKYKRHLNEVRKAVGESAQESHEEALRKAKEAEEESEESKENKKIPRLDELLAKITPENRHDETFVVPVGKERI